MIRFTTRKDGFRLRNTTMLERLFALVSFVSLIAGFSFYKIPDLMLSLTQLAVIFIVFLLGFTGSKAIGRKDFRIGVAFTLLYVFVYLGSVFKGFYPSTSLYIYAFFAGAFIMFSEKSKVNIFDIFIKLYCVLMVISLVEFFFIVMGVGFKLGEVSRLESHMYYYDHYIFNLIESDSVFPRFQSILHEPGDIGTFNGLLLFGVINKPKYRKEYLVLLLSGLISMSLAFYVLFLIHLFLNVKKIRFWAVISVIASLTVLFFVFQDSVNTLIVERVIEQNYDNRNSELMNDVFQKASEQHTLFWGNGAGSSALKTGGGSAGAKVFIYDYGYWGLLLLIMAFSLVYFGNAKKMSLYQVLFYFVFWASFYQRQNIYEVQIIMALLAPLLLVKATVVENNYSNQTTTGISRSTISV